MTVAPAAEQQTLEGMPQRLFTCTPSRLTTWLDCPRRYRFIYVDRPTPPKGPPWAHNSVGAAVHTALAALVGAAARASAPRARPPTSSRRAGSRSASATTRSSAEWRERAASMVARYVADLDPHDEPLGVERTVAFAHRASCAVSGRIDRLDERGDDLVVVDYKTGRHVLTTDDARGSLALALYALAAARTLRRRCVRVELHHLPTGDVISWEHDDPALVRQLERAHDIAAEAAAAEASGDPAAFPARPGPMCGWCDFSAHCAEGRAARAVQPPWAGLATDIAPLSD